MRGSTAIKTAAGAIIATGVVTPLIRKRLKMPAPLVTAAAAAAPFALNVVMPRSRKREYLTCAMQMWAYLATYQMPNDDPEALKRRVKVDYPVKIDCLLGLGKTPTMRLQRAFGRPGRHNRIEKTLIWTHWIWFIVPQTALLYINLRHRKHFARSACLIYATFDLGAVVYWLLPTAPPWYAALQGHMDDGRTPELRRMMVEYGEQFWKSQWGPLYSTLGGNPLAAMPSLHFATSLMAAHVLSDCSPVAGAVGWGYVITLAVALVYLGEHYVIDLIAGGALTEGIRLLDAPLTPTFQRISNTIKSLELRSR